MRGKSPLRKVIMKMKTNAVAWNPIEVSGTYDQSVNMHYIMDILLQSENNFYQRYRTDSSITQWTQDLNGMLNVTLTTI